MRPVAQDVPTSVSAWSHERAPTSPLLVAVPAAGGGIPRVGAVRGPGPAPVGGARLQHYGR